MAIWRSPLLYFGLAVILLVAAALAAPHVVDFNRYKPQIAAWGERLTGRKVAIHGDVRVRLFPWPTLSLHQVSVVNPPGARQPDFLFAEEIRARLSLAALLSGTLQIEQVHFLRPIASFERLADGRGTWRLRPRGGLRLPFSPERIAIAGITIEDGTAIFADARRGGQARLEAISARVSAPRLSGPWRLSATGLLQGAPVSLSLTTGRIRKGQPVNVSLRISPRDRAGFLYAFDGRWNAPRKGAISGRLRIRPVAARGKQDPPAGLSLYEYSAQVLATFDEVWLKAIEATPLSAARSADRITGNAHITLGTVLQVEAALKASRFDLDYAFGEDARRHLSPPALLRALGEGTAALPEDLMLRLDLSTPSLHAGGQALEGFRLLLEASSEQLAIENFATSLPGGARLSFRGRLLPPAPASPDARATSGAAPASSPQLSGTAQFSARSLRDFALWALPEHAGAISRLWTGARGNFSLHARIDATGNSLHIPEGSFALDADKGALRLTLRGDDAEDIIHLDLSLDADSLNIDRYAPSGLAADAPAGAGEALSELLIAAMSLGETSLAISAGRLHAFGLPMEDAAISIVATADLLEVRNFDIGDMAGARMEAAALLRFPDGGITGNADVRISSADAAPLWRLLAGLPRGARQAPAWLGNVGKVDLALKLSAREVPQGAKISATLGGTAGPASISGKLGFSGRPDSWRKGDVDLKLNLNSRAAAPLLALFGLAPHGTDGPASLSLSARGRPREGLAVEASATLLGLEGRLLGKARAMPPSDGGQEEGGFSGEGRLALRALRIAPLLRTAGLAAPPQASGAAHVEGDVAFSPGHAALRNMRGAVAGTSLSGELRTSWAEEMPRISGRIVSERLNLPALARIWLVSPQEAAARHGGRPGMEKSAQKPQGAAGQDAGGGRFRPGALSGFRAGLDLRGDVLTLLPGMEMKDARISFSVEDGTMKLDISAAGGRERLSAAISASGAPAGLAFSGRVDAALDLGLRLRRADGRPLTDGTARLQGTWQATSRSLEGLATALRGEGSLDLGKGRLIGLSPRRFMKAVLKAASAAEVERLARSALHAGDLPFPGGQAALKAEGGLISAAPIAFSAQGFAITLRPLASLPEGRLDISLSFRDDHAPQVPPFSVAFAGPPRALATVHDLEELKGWVSITTLRRSMEKLERVERERRRVLEEDSAFERQQAMFARWRAWHARQLRREKAQAHRDALVRRQEDERRAVLIRSARQRAAEQARRQARERARQMHEKARKEAEARRREMRRQQPVRPATPAPQAAPAPQPPAATARLPAPRAQQRRKASAPAKPAESTESLPEPISIQELRRALAAPPVPRQRPPQASHRTTPPQPGAAPPPPAPEAPVRIVPPVPTPPRPRVKTNFTSTR